MKLLPSLLLGSVVGARAQGAVAPTAATTEAPKSWTASDGTEIFYWLTDGTGTVPKDTPCVFPFTYQGEKFSSCILTDMYPEWGWCGVVKDVDKSGLWGGCKKGAHKDSKTLSLSACPEGTFFSDADEKCHFCEAGTFAPAGARECLPCEKGKVTSVSGSSYCGRCGPGEYAPNTGMKACEECPVGTYQPDSGAAECLACPDGQTSLGGASRCISNQKKETPVPTAAPPARLVLPPKMNVDPSCIKCVSRLDATCSGGPNWDEACDAKAVAMCSAECKIAPAPTAPPQKPVTPVPTQPAPSVAPQPPATVAPTQLTQACVTCVNAFDKWCAGGKKWDVICAKYGAAKCPSLCPLAPAGVITAVPVPGPPMPIQKASACVACTVQFDPWCIGAGQWDLQCQFKSVKFCAAYCQSPYALPVAVPASGGAVGAVNSQYPTKSAACVSCVHTVDPFCGGDVNWWDSLCEQHSQSACKASCPTAVIPR